MDARRSPVTGERERERERERESEEGIIAGVRALRL
jgi:hypothetical protein